MHLKRTLRTVLLGFVLCGGSILGVPMRPEEIEELMFCIDQPKIEVSVDEGEVEDEKIRQILGQMR